MIRSQTRTSNRSNPRSTLSAALLMTAIGAAMLAASPASAATPDSKPAAKPASSPAASTGWLSGRVVDPDGNPAAGVLITIELPPAAMSKRAERTVRGAKEGPKAAPKPVARFVRATTDWAGRFHVGNLPDSHATNWVYPVVARSTKFGEAVTAAVVRGGDDTSVSIEFRSFDPPFPTGRNFSGTIVGISSITTINGGTSAR